MTTQRKTGGFTLIEMMITVAIIGILTAIALPSYRNYVIRGKLVAGTNALATMRASMEQYYQDNRTYMSVSASSTVTPCTANAVTASNSLPFNVNCATTGDVPTATTYRLRASGTGAVAGAVYTIDQTGAMTTVSYPTVWGGTASLPSNANCWLMRKGDSC
jgi:type IV pilus assembly protein PilE